VRNKKQLLTELFFYFVSKPSTRAKVFPTVAVIGSMGLWRKFFYSVRVSGELDEVRCFDCIGISGCVGSRILRGQVSDFARLGLEFFVRNGSWILRGFDGKSRAGVRLFVIGIWVTGMGQ
jgi:hypothetical protein